MQLSDYVSPFPKPVAPDDYSQKKNCWIWDHSDSIRSFLASPSSKVCPDKQAPLPKLNGHFFNKSGSPASLIGICKIPETDNQHDIFVNNNLV